MTARHARPHAVLLLTLSLSVLTPALDAQKTSAPPDLDAYVDRVMKTFQVPGLALAIVKDDQVVVAKGFGVRRLGGADPVDGKTLFGIASNTKAFTATALALLEEQGKIEWDAPVTTYHDDSRAATRHCRAHEPGIGRHARLDPVPRRRPLPPRAANRLADRVREVRKADGKRAADGGAECQGVARHKLAAVAAARQIRGHLHGRVVRRRDDLTRRRKAGDRVHEDALTDNP